MNNFTEDDLSDSLKFAWGVQTTTSTAGQVLQNPNYSDPDKEKLRKMLKIIEEAKLNRKLGNYLKKIL